MRHCPTCTCAVTPSPEFFAMERYQGQWVWNDSGVVAHRVIFDNGSMIRTACGMVLGWSSLQTEPKGLDGCRRCLRGAKLKDG